MKKSKKVLSKNVLLKKLGSELKESEIFYRHLAEITPEALVIHSQGRIEFANPAAAKIIGAKRPEQLMGQHIMQFVHPDSRKIVAKRVQMMLEKKIIAPVIEEKFIDLKGNTVFAQVKAIPFTLHEKTAILVILHDVSEQKQIEKNLSFLSHASKILSSSLDYKKTLQNVARLAVPLIADWAIIDIIRDEQIVDRVAVIHSNRQMKKLVKILQTKYPPDLLKKEGVPKNLLTGKSNFTPVMSESVLRAASQDEEHYKILKTLGFDSGICVTLKTGTKVFGAMTLIYGPSQRKYTRADYIMAQELANRAGLAIENARLYTESQSALSLRDDFISVASHELKTPITSLKMYTEIIEGILQKNSDKKALQYLTKMDNQVNKLTSLINDLLNISRMKLGKLEFYMEKFSLLAVVRETVENIQLTTKTHKIIIKGTTKRKVWGDRDRIGQVLTNLLTNAMKYSPHSNKVVIDLTTEKDVAVVGVQDFGIGIDKEHQKRIFERFYRVGNPEEKTYPGLGIGLYICNEIIKRHRGRIEVTSNKGKGARFTFTIPYDK